MSSGVRGLHHVQLAIPSGGEEAGREFWGGVLGVTELVKPPVLAARGGCWFRSDRLEIHLGVEDPFTPAAKAHPGILVEDLDRIIDALTRAGHQVRRDDGFPGFDRCYTADPFGNRLEFLEPVGPDLTVRFPAPGDERDIRAAQTELEPDGFTFAFDLDDDFEGWCREVRAAAEGVGVTDGWVRSILHVGVLEGDVVGRLSVRPELNDFLRRRGGHLGYGVRPGWRGRGVAGALLAHGLGLLAEEGVTQALLTCDDDNRASAAVIERAGGVLQDVADVDGHRTRRYLLPTGAAR